MCRKLICSIILVCMLDFGSMAQAELFDPAIENPSFEATDLGAGGTGQWVDYAENWIINNQGNCYLEDGSWEITAPDGVATLKMWNGAAIWQQIGTWSPSTDYEISLWVGRGMNTSDILVELWAGGNPALIPDSGFGTIDGTVGATLIEGAPLVPTITVGENEWMSLILNTGAGFNSGDPLWLRIESTGEAAWVDNVMVVSVRDPILAYNPNPASGATDVTRDAVLSWAPGMFAQSHDVYFGTNFDNVNDASRTNPLDVLVIEGQDANNYDIGRLEFSQTYFWRIDEVNAPPDSTIYKGDLWSFTVEPIAYPIPAESITATASSQAQGNGPENTVNGSGLSADDLHSADPKEMWLSEAGDPGSAWIQYEFDKPCKLYEMFVWNYNGNGILSLYGLKEVTIEYSTDGASWAQVGVSELAQGIGQDDYAYNTTVAFDGVAAKYVKITGNNNFGGGTGFFNQYGLSEVRFTAIPVSAKEPNPDIGATNVAVNTNLSWIAGREAVEHTVHLSTDQQAVTDGSALITTVSQTSYSPTLDLDSTYYWRIDEVNNAEATTTWPGDIWNFSTQEYLVVDDFESYNDIPEGQEGSNLVYITWEDGFANPSTNGSTIGYISGMSMETGNIYGGEQAVPLLYNNTTASKSEVTVNPGELSIGRNWSIGSPQTLVLWIHGDPGNNSAADQLYVKVGNSKVIYDGDIAKPQWKQWNIDLVAMGVNLSNVSTMTIGLERTGGSGGSGMVFIDEIRLYREAPPLPSEEIWIEAEAVDSIETPMMVYSDPNASGGQYIAVEEGNTSSDGPPAAGGVARYTITVQGGTYKISGRVISPNDTDDSFYFNIPGATTQTANHSSGWVQWNSIEIGSNWHWDVVHSTDDDATEVEWTLTAGTHTLEIAYREDGALLDAIVITSID